MKLFYIFLALVFFGFSFWAFAQDFTGSTILSILSILAGIVGLIKGFLFDDGF